MSKSQEKHEANLAELGDRCRAVCELMEYFNPPNLMAWRDDDENEWDVFIRRKGSDTQFGPEEFS